MNIIQEMGIKELEHVVLKARTTMSFGDRTIEPGEPILYFENLQISNLTEDTRIVSANGGRNNQPKVIWEDRGTLQLAFTNGTVNPITLQFILEGAMDTRTTSKVPYAEQVEVFNNQIELKYTPILTEKIFLFYYDYSNIQNKINIADCIVTPKTPPLIGATITLPSGCTATTVMADYYFIPKNAIITYTLARERLANTYKLEATFQLKDENEGIVHTGLIEMPKVFIQSNINLRLGERADPMVGTFYVTAQSESNEQYNDVVCRITYSDDDLYAI